MPMPTGPLSPARAGRVIWRHAAALSLFSVLTAVMVNPLVRDPARLTVGWEGDNLMGIRQLWWVKHALLDLHRSPYFDPGSDYPVGHDLAHGELFPATTILAIPVTVWWGPVVAYNAAMFLSFVLMGLGTYVWVNDLSGSGGGAVVAGIIAAFLPYRFAHVLGHLEITSTEWLPWALYAFERFLVRKSPARGAVLGLSVGLVALSAWYYAYSISIILPIYALARSRPWREHWDRRWWQGLGVAAVVAATLVTPFMVPYMKLKLHGGLTRSIGEMDFWSLNFYAFFLPNRLNPAWSGFMEQHFLQDTAQWVERGVSLGYTALALALFAIARRSRSVSEKWEHAPSRPASPAKTPMIRRITARVARLLGARSALLGRAPGHPAISAVLIVWAASYLVALGPTLHMGDRQVLVEIPTGVTAASNLLLAPFGEKAQAWRHRFRPRSVPVPLPAFFLYRFVPLTSSMRVMARFGVWTGLMTAALAGWGAAALLQHVRRPTGRRALTSGMVVVAIAGLVLAESYSRLPVIVLRPRAVDVWLGQQPHGDWAVVELPLEQTLRFFQDYYKTVHQQPTLFGSPADAFPSDAYARRHEALETFPSSNALAMLRECRVRYVLFTPSEIPTWLALKAKIDATDGMRLDREIGGVLVYLLE